MNLNNVRNVKLPSPGPPGALVKVLLLGGLGVYGAVNSLYNVEGGHCAIVFNRIVGVKDKVCLHSMVPWFDRPVICDVRARPHVVESTSGSKDLQMVRISVSADKTYG